MKDSIERIKKELLDLNERVKRLEIDIEPDGRISEGFDRLTEELDDLKKETRKRFDRLEYQNTQMLAKLSIIMESLTGEITPDE